MNHEARRNSFLPAQPAGHFCLTREEAEQAIPIGGPLNRALLAGPEVGWVTALTEAGVLGHCHYFVVVAGQRRPWCARR
jgi:hypothetical protein